MSTRLNQLMQLHRIQPLYLLTLLILSLGRAQAQYSITILHPLSDFTDSEAYAAANGKQVGHAFDNLFGYPHAIIWSGSNTGYVDLDTGEYPYGTAAFGTNGSKQVGIGTNPFDTRALLWSGSAASKVVLQPVGLSTLPGVIGSGAYGCAGTQQVGYAYNQFQTHAMLWTGTAASAVDLHPQPSKPGGTAPFTGTIAFATSGSQQVGWGDVSTGIQHALLWNGTASSFLDLHPAGFQSSTASAIAGSQQAGQGVNGVGGATKNGHALLWSGTAASAVDLHPAAFAYTTASGLSSTVQVGYGKLGNKINGLVWAGNSDSALNLQVFLPSSYDESWAYGIDEAGNIVGSAHNAASNHVEAVLWTKSAGSCPTIIVNPATLPGGVQGTGYTQIITASGGAPSHSFSVATGLLPPGLNLSAAGVLSGTPTTGGAFYFTVKALDQNGCAGTRSYLLTVPCSGLSMSPATLPGGTAGAYYSQSITASGGTAPFIFTVTSGSLPLGLTLTEDGLLSGPPSSSGSYTFTITATDVNGCAISQSYTLNISGACSGPVINSVQVTPALASGGDTLNVSANVTSPCPLTSVQANGKPLADSGGGVWQGNITALASLGPHTVTVVATDSDNHSAINTSGNYRTVKIVGTSNKNAGAPIISAAKNVYLFVLWGKVTKLDNNSFTFSDGSSQIVKVIANGHTLATGDFARARGTLNNTTTPPTLTSSASLLQKY